MIQDDAMNANFTRIASLDGHHRYHIMANTPHGGILKVRLRPINPSARSYTITLLSKDLLARDEAIHHALTEESLTLADIILSEVTTPHSLFRVQQLIVFSDNFVTLS